MPKSSKKEEPKKVEHESDDFGDEDDGVPVKKAKVQQPAKASEESDTPPAQANPSTNPSTNPPTALVKAATTAIGPVCSVNEGKKRLNKLLGSTSKMQAEVNPMGNKKKNYVVVKGVCLSKGEHTYTSKKDGASSAFTKYTLSIAAQSIQPLSSASLCYGGSTDDPACNFAIPNKIVHKIDKKSEKDPDHRYAPENVRLVNLSCRDYTLEKKAIPEQNVWYEKAQPGAIVEATLELKIPKGQDVQTAFVEMHAVSVHVRIPADASECNAAASTLKYLFNDPVINATNYDTLVDMCGGMNAFRYGTDADEAEDVDPSILALNDDETAEKRAELMLPGNFDKRATAEFNLRMHKRKATLAKELKRNTLNFPEDTDAMAKPNFEQFADQLLVDDGYKQLHELLGLTDKDSQGLYIMCSNNMRLMQLSEDVKLPKRFCEALVQHVEIAANKSFLALQFSFVLCPDSTMISKYLKEDVEGTFILRSQQSVNDDTMKSRLTLRVDMTRMANVFATRSTEHLINVIHVLLPKAQMFLKTSVKNPAPVSNGTGALDDRYIESMIIDVPGALKQGGIPVSPEWVKAHLCEGMDMFNGLDNVTKAKPDDKSYTPMIDFNKNAGEVVTRVDERAFINLTEYKGASIGKKSPLFSAPMNNPVRMVVVLDHPDVNDWYEEIRETEQLSPYHMASNGQGEAFLDSLYESENKKAEKGDALESLGDFLLKYNASVFAVLEGKQEPTAMELA